VDAQRWQQVRSVLEAALERSPSERPAFLEAACGGDPTLEAEVRTLLGAHDRAQGFLDSPAVVPPELGRGEVDAGTEPELPAGTELGPWTVTGIAGRGGMGVVYRARRNDGAFEREVAIKLVRGALDSRALLARFQAERRILATLDHPGIAALLDAGTTPDGVPYLVLELIEGESIDAWCASRRLGLRERLELFLAVCDAVAHAHQRLVLHRDLKPSNILVTADGQPKLLDFGIAKLLDPSTGVESEATVTRLGGRALTPEYASPEQIAGEPLDTRSDVWSLGVVLYRLLTGRHPFLDPVTGRSTGAAKDFAALPSVAASRSEKSPVAWRALRGDLDAIVEKALARERDRRWATVGELAADLRRHLDGRPVSARPPLVGYRLARFVRRNRLAVAAGAAVLVAISTATAVSVYQASVARRERDVATRRFAETRQLANTLLFSIDEAIRHIAGGTEARRLLVTTGLEYLDRLAAEAGDDDALLAEVASGYERLGEIQGGFGLSHVGDSEAALESFEKAAALRQRVLDGEAELGDEFLAQVAAGSSDLAGGLLSVGRVKDALEHSARAVEMRDQLRSRQPESEQAVRDLAVALSIHGYMVGANGDFDGGIVPLRRAVDLLEPLVARPGGETDSGQHYALVLSRLGMLLRELPDHRGLDEARSVFERAIEVSRRLAASDRHREDFRRGLARDLSLLATVETYAGNHQRSLEANLESLPLLEAAVAEDPADRTARRNLVILKQQTAENLIGLERQDEAIAMLEPALAEVEALLAEDAQSMPLQFTVSYLARLLGRAHRGLAERAPSPDAHCAAAVAPLERAVAVLQPLVESGVLHGDDLAQLDLARADLAACRALIGHPDPS
jgi:non-specific serine/threonine protein kinase/serine/threonine-protein kinase